jgi:hypothetical protein
MRIFESTPLTAQGFTGRATVFVRFLTEPADLLDDEKAKVFRPAAAIVRKLPVTYR